jgi:hypothetical protein
MVFRMVLCGERYEKVYAEGRTNYPTLKLDSLYAFKLQNSVTHFPPSLSNHPKIEHWKLGPLHVTGSEGLGIRPLLVVPRIPCVNQDGIIRLQW